MLHGRAASLIAFLVIAVLSARRRDRLGLGDDE
jgi:hypothetical protein